MLAACTIGPGSVVVCAKAGADHGLDLIWCLILASFMSFTLMEGTARLTIVSGRTLGHCLQEKTSKMYSCYEYSLAGWGISIAVWMGNTMYMINNYAGGYSAILTSPADPADRTWFRLSSCAIFALLVLTLLYLDKADELGTGLGLCLIFMCVLFCICTVMVGVDFEDLAMGIIPSIPNDASDIVLGLVGTTAIGFNIFLGGDMAVGKSLWQARAGIAFSTIATLITSILILICGTGAPDGEDFDVYTLADVIRDKTGLMGHWCFSVGFVAAAVSSMITCALGAAVTIDSLYPAKRIATTVNYTFTSQLLLGSDSHLAAPPGDMVVRSRGATLEDVLSNMKNVPPRVFFGIMVSTQVVAFAVISAGVNLVAMVTLAQVFNGCLLPMYTFCLLFCLNDAKFMGKQPQTWTQNLSLLFAVLISTFLSCNVVLQNILPNSNDNMVIAIAFGAAFVIFLLICFLTKSGRAALASLLCWSDARKNTFTFGKDRSSTVGILVEFPTTGTDDLVAWAGNDDNYNL